MPTEKAYVWTWRDRKPQPDRTLYHYTDISAAISEIVLGPENPHRGQHLVIRKFLESNGYDKELIEIRESIATYQYDCLSSETSKCRRWNSWQHQTCRRQRFTAKLKTEETGFPRLKFSCERKPPLDWSAHHLRTSYNAQDINAAGEVAICFYAFQFK